MERMQLHSHQEIPSRMGGFHRRYRRGSVSGFFCDIADGHRLITGVVDDISSNGFRMTQVRDVFSSDGHSYWTVLSGNGRHYKLLAKPCWKRNTENGFEIGFKILDVSWEWFEFVLATVGQPSPGDLLEGNA